MVREFWIWAAWVDKGRPGRLPWAVAQYYLARGITKAPATWVARYAIHKGIVQPIQNVLPAKGRAQYVLFAASDPLQGLGAKSKYAIAMSADPGFANVATPEVVSALRFKGHRVYSWCDCRPSGGTPAQAAIDMKARLKLDEWVGQSENPPEATEAWGHHAEIIVGQLAALNDAQKKDIADGKVLWIEEDFWNAMPWNKPNYQNLPVAASCKGVYDATSENPPYGRSLQWEDYVAAGRVTPGDGLFSVEHVQNWSALP